MLNRVQYFVRFVIVLALYSAGSFFLLPLPKYGRFLFAFFVVVLALYKIFGLDVPRLRNADISRLMLFLYLIPIVNLILVAVLFFAPPKYGDG
jgi:hypothetical protein